MGKKVWLALSSEWLVYRNGKQVGTERDATLVGKDGQVAHFEGRWAEDEARMYAQKNGYEIVSLAEFKALMK